MSMSDWAARELADTLRDFCSGLSVLHHEHGDAVRLLTTEGMMWSDYIARAERISWWLAAYTYAHAEQVRRYREAIEAETAKYEDALRQLQVGQMAVPKPEESN